MTRAVIDLTTDSENNRRLIEAAYRALLRVLRLFCGKIRGDILLQLTQRALVELAVAEQLNVAPAVQVQSAQQRNSRPANASLPIALDSKRGNRAPAAGAKLTLTAIALSTGLDTRHIRRLLAEPCCIRHDDLYPEAAILKRWQQDPSLVNPLTKSPALLVIYGPKATFQSLVRSVLGRGVSTTAVLSRLRESGHVQVVRRHYVQLVESHWQGLAESELETLEDAVQQLCCNLQEPGRRRASVLGGDAA